MIKYLEKAVENFFANTLGLEYSFRDVESFDSVYLAQIELNSSESNNSFTFAVSQELLNSISDVLLFDPTPDYESAIDLVGEVANLIIGNMKVVWESEEEGIELHLTPPEFLGFMEEKLRVVNGSTVGIDVDGKVMSVALAKELVEA